MDIKIIQMTKKQFKSNSSNEAFNRLNKEFNSSNEAFNSLIELKNSSNEQKNSSNEQKSSSNEQKNSSNEQKIFQQFSTKFIAYKGYHARGRALQPHIHLQPCVKYEMLECCFNYFLAHN